MIVSVGVEDGLSVLIDDQIEDYNPIRAGELVALARATFRDAMKDAQAAAGVDDED